MKARVQRQGGVTNDGAQIRSGFQVARDLAVLEGPGAFFKGCVPKCTVVAPKVMFAYSLANWIASQLTFGRR